MDRTLFITQTMLVAALLTVHFYALLNDLYWHYLWLDIPMHFVGGFWASLASIWFLRRTPLALSFMNVLAGVIIISVAWEIMEYVAGFQREQNYAFDTSLDLVMDILGGICGFLLARNMIQSAINGSPQDNPSEPRRAA